MKSSKPWPIGVPGRGLPACAAPKIPNRMIRVLIQAGRRYWLGNAGDSASMSAGARKGYRASSPHADLKTSLRRVGCQLHRRLVVMRWASVVMVAVAAHVVIVIVLLAGWAACEAHLGIRDIEAPRALVVRRL